MCCDAAKRPTAVRRGRRSGTWRRVERIVDIWRLDDAWWRPERVQRCYYRLNLAMGEQTDIFQDMVSGEWYEQRYAMQRRQG